MKREIKFRRILFETISTIWKSAIPILIFEFLYNMTMVSIFKPFINIAFSFFVKLSGHSALINEEIKKFLLSFFGIITVFIFINIFVLIAYYEYAVLLIMLNDGYNNVKIKIKKSMVEAYYKLKLFYNKNNLGLALYILVLIPLLDIGVQSSFFPKLNIPNFITGEVAKYNGGEYLIGLFIILISILYVKLFLVLPIMVVEEKSFKEASKKSFKIMKKNTIKVAIISLLILIIWTLIAFIPTMLLDNAEGNLLTILKYLSVLSLMILTVLVSPMMLGVMLTTYKPSEEFLLSEEAILEREMNLITLETKVDIFKEKIKINFKRFFKKIKNKPILIIPIIIILGTLFYLNLPVNINYVVKDTLNIGHRGSKVGVENTIEAILEGAKNGAEYIEIDILLSKDGIPMVIHDNNLSRLSGVKNKVSNMTREELSKVQLQDRGYVGKISTLEELLKEVDGKVKLLIEFKSHGSEKKSVVEESLKLVKKYDTNREHIFHTGEMPLFKEFKSLDTEYKIGYIIIGKIGILGKDTIRNIKADFLVFEESMVNQSLVNTCHILNIPVFAWTINDESMMEELIKMKVDGVITDYPYMLLKTKEKVKENNILENILKEKE